MYPEVTSVYVPVKNKDYRALAILLSVIGHSVLLGSIVYFHKEAPPPPMQTMLISPQELADMQSQIQANTNSEDNNAGETASQKHKTDPNTAKLMQQIAEQEALFQQNKAKMAEQLDKEFNAQQQQIIDELDEQLAEKQAVIEDFERAESKIDEIEASLRAEMDKAKQQNLERIANQQIKAENKDISKDGERLSDNEKTATSGEKRGSNTNVASYRDAIVSKIYSNWSPPTNSDGKSLRVTLRLSPTGAVISTNITGDDSFSKSLKEAISKSSPLPVPSDLELFQKNFANLTVKFEGK